MAYKNESYTPQEQICIEDIFEILAPTISKPSFWWGQNKVNWIDGAASPEYGIWCTVMGQPDNFFPAYKLLDVHFPQQIVNFSRNKFIQVNHHLVAREVEDRLLPDNWTVKNEQDLIRYSGGNQLKVIVERLQWVFRKDLEMGTKVRALVAPTI